ncbi:MAG: hypothetical protein J5641_07550, partial [Bacteroidales bacterium]|nr:hypothetical protein [Bacteroidales bacterium]
MKHTARHIVFFVLIAGLLAASSMSAQEVLLPVKYQPLPGMKEGGERLTLPFFDDFSSMRITQRNWQLGGTFINEGYAPLPPTRGMATLDAFDADGCLYPTTTEQLFSCDTLTSMPIRLDSIFEPYQRPLAAEDSIYLSFFYLPGGGYGNMWERIGDCPESADSLVLEFFDAENNTWDRIWSSSGCPADTLFARTGSYWQFQDICITESKYLHKDFRFRFRNYCSLSNLNKTGIISNADQWNIDYVLINAGRTLGDKTSRDVAFVMPAPSMLEHYQAMPARQFTATEMAENVPLTITNLFAEELATDYRYHVYNEQGVEVYAYDGGYENIPVFWRGLQYQTSPAHAYPPVGYTFAVADDEPRTYTVVHHVRDGVSGDIHTQNDSATFLQVFDNYYAYDDGVPENGYGLTSTSSHVKIAYRFRLNVEDTLTALYMYFNRTLRDENADIRFAITVWDDADGVPGNIIYQDANRRKPLFEGFNQYVRYLLEEPVVCNGTIYVGFEQYSPDYINLGFDRNHDASTEILYLSSTSWQTSILRGALMMRPYFGHRATLAVKEISEADNFNAYTY